MTDPINTQNRPRQTGVSSDTKSGSATKSGGGAAASNRSGASQSNASTVELSNTAVLQELEEQIKNLPEINDVRIEAVKQALSNGEYEPDAEVIARKYIEIEKLLP